MPRQARCGNVFIIGSIARRFVSNRSGRGSLSKSTDARSNFIRSQSSLADFAILGKQEQVSFLFINLRDDPCFKSINDNFPMVSVFSCTYINNLIKKALIYQPVYSINKLNF